MRCPEAQKNESSFITVLDRIRAHRVMRNEHKNSPDCVGSGPPSQSVLFVEVFLKCEVKCPGKRDQSNLLLERWTLSLLSEKAEKSEMTFWASYLSSGEVSQFIDQTNLSDSALFLSFETSSQFIGPSKCLDFPAYSARSDAPPLSIRVEWLPLRLSMSKSGTTLSYLCCKTEFTISLQEDSILSQSVQQTTKVHIPSPVRRESLSPRLAKGSGPSKAVSLAEKFKSTTLLGPRRLVGSFEENIIMGFLYPAGYIESFSLQLSSLGSDGGTFPTTAFFFDSFVDSPNLRPYLGYTDLRHLHPGYRISEEGMIQMILFNPNETVIKIFLVKYDLRDMPPNSTTFIRQKITYSPTEVKNGHVADFPAYLQYCVHLRVLTDHENGKYLYSEIRIIFPSHPLELESDNVKYELVTNVVTPSDPTYCPIS